MRRRRAGWAAAAIGTTVVAVVAMLAALRPSPERTDGAVVYERLGCPACHALAGHGDAGIPLDGVGSRLDRDAIRTWIVAPTRMDPSVSKPAYDRVPAADVDAVVDFLAGSRAPADSPRSD